MSALAAAPSLFCLPISLENLSRCCLFIWCLRQSRVTFDFSQLHTVPVRWWGVCERLYHGEVSACLDVGQGLGVCVCARAHRGVDLLCKKGVGSVQTGDLRLNSNSFNQSADGWFQTPEHPLI